MEEFSKNRYYKSTLIWHEGLNGWISIADSEELKHLIGTIENVFTDAALPQSVSNLTPPLTEVITQNPHTNRKFTLLWTAIVLLLIGGYFYFSHKSANTPNATVPVIFNDSTMSDSNGITIVGAEAEMKTYRLNWEKLILVQPNDFKQRKLGGIADLKILVENNTPYLVDSIKVKVNYLKANGEIFQTILLRFDNINGNATKDLFAPNSERGVNVTCEILSINSHAMELCFDKSKHNASILDGGDPFHCVDH